MCIYNTGVTQSKGRGPKIGEGVSGARTLPYFRLLFANCVSPVKEDPEEIQFRVLLNLPCLLPAAAATLIAFQLQLDLGRVFQFPFH